MIMTVFVMITITAKTMMTTIMMMTMMTMIIKPAT